MTFCREEILRRLAEPPDADWIARAAGHARACPRCADLLPFLEPAPPELPPAVEAPPELLDGVLGATGGASAACDAAEQRLAARDAVDQALEAHLARCAGCRAIARALDTVDATLPELAAVDPGPSFTADVLRRTSRAPSAAAATAGFPGWIARLLTRPRFALEFAYGGALLVWLVAGAAGLSLATPARWLAEEPAEAIGRVGRGIEALPVERVDEVASLDPVRTELRARYGGTAPLRQDVGDARRELAASLSRGDFSGAGDAAGELALGIVRLPGRFLKTPETKPRGAEPATRRPR